MHLRLGKKLAPGIENHRPDALRPLIDGQEEVFAFPHGVPVPPGAR